MRKRFRVPCKKESLHYLICACSNVFYNQKKQAAFCAACSLFILFIITI